MLTKDVLIILLIVAVAVLGSLLVFKEVIFQGAVFSGFTETKYLSLTELRDACVMRDKSSVVCCIDNGKVADCTDKKTFKCGEPVVALLNVSKFTLPDFYQFCAEFKKLENQDEGIRRVSKYYSYDTLTDTVFSCYPTTWNSTEHRGFYNVGRLPNSSQEVILYNAYIFPSSFNYSVYSTVEEFQSNLQKATNLAGLTVNVKC